MSAIAMNGKRLQPGPVEPDRPERSLSVVTLNAAKVTDASRIAADLASSPRLRGADVYLMQEVANEADKPGVAEQLAERLGYQSTFSPAAPGVYDQGLAILSRYPLSHIEIRRLKWCDLRFRCRTRFALSADVRTPSGDIRLWNVHLDTRINADERLEQLRPIIEEAARRPGASIIAGDFNTNECRWVGNVVPVPGGPGHGALIRQTMEAHGFRTPLPDGLATFTTLNRHLDWIYVNGLQPLRWSVEPAPFSDHHAVWTRLVLP
ncbi:MAG: endonuclease/exonuclease/phosphatase family protein [Bryobacteraceae bacterium]|nr:endonuclease/exonuclease/phosphatase family protein [Bryobacteraceae bacterium]